MSDEHPTDLLAALPRTRPHRRSDKRTTPPPAAHTAPKPAAAAAEPKPKATAMAPRRPRNAANAAAGRKAARPAAKQPGAKPLRQPAQPRGIPAARRAPKRKPAPAAAPELVGTAIKAVGELAEIGLTLTARALRNAAARLPKP